MILPTVTAGQQAVIGNQNVPMQQQANSGITEEQAYNEALMQKQYDLNLQYARDYYSSAVEGMKRAGLNPALMYSSGVNQVAYSGTAPYNTTDTSAQRYNSRTTADASMVSAIGNLINSFSNLLNPKTKNYTKINNW